MLVFRVLLIAMLYFVWCKYPFFHRKSSVGHHFAANCFISFSFNFESHDIVDFQNGEFVRNQGKQMQVTFLFFSVAFLRWKMTEDKAT